MDETTTKPNGVNIRNTFSALIRKINFKRLLISLLCIVAILGAGGSYYFYGKYNAIRANPNLEAQKKTEGLILAVGKLMELPQGETPTIATISDKEKLKDQPFFKTAENGDKLFAYNTAMIAILYRPRTNKIINVAPISINQQQNGVSGTTGDASTPAPPRIAYYNGTQTVGLSGLAEKIVKEKYPSWQTAAMTNASKKDYKKTLVVDLSGRHSQEASNLAGLLNGNVALMPAGEVRPDADILIISGK